MFKKIISAILFVVLFSSIANATYVRFAVNMKGSGMLSSNDAYMVSTFQSEIGMGLDMANGYLHLIQSTTDTNIYYSPVYNIPAFQEYEYFFVLGSNGYSSENVPIESQDPSNGLRWFYVDSLGNDTLQMPAVFYSGNNTATDTMYRFRVNMSNETVSANGVYVGPFKSFNPSTYKMYSFGNGVYEYMAFFAQNSSLFYKFYNGSNANGETVPSNCTTITSFREIDSVINAQILPIVCFGSCVNCYPSNTTNVNKNNGITLSPNPMSINATITFNDLASSHSVSIIDIYGRTIKYYKNITTNSFSIDKEMMNASCYLLQIVNDKNEQTTLKLIVE
jgi:hypothetical protein